MRNILSERMRVNGSDIIIPLDNYYVVIKNQYSFYHLCIKDSKKEELIFIMGTLEEAFEFTEDVVDNTDTLDDILAAFKARVERQKRGINF